MLRRRRHRRTPPLASRRCSAITLAALAWRSVAPSSGRSSSSPRRPTPRSRSTASNAARAGLSRRSASPRPSRSTASTPRAFGFEDFNLAVLMTTPEGELRMDMKPRLKPITINVEPADAQLFLDGRPISEAASHRCATNCPSSSTPRRRPAQQTLRAERPSASPPVEIPINFTDDQSQYMLRLDPLKKDLVIATNPPGAALTLDGADIGARPSRSAASPSVTTRSAKRSSRARSSPPRPAIRRRGRDRLGRRQERVRRAAGRSTASACASRPIRPTRR